MSHHAYLAEGEQEEALARVDAFLTGQLGFIHVRDQDIERHTALQLNVADARAIHLSALRSPAGGNGKTIVIATHRFFHEAQNALLKILEEPPAGVTFILIVPRAGILLPTLRSRLMPLPTEGGKVAATHPLVSEFLAGDDSTREKLIAKLVDRAKDDKDEVKQQARADAVALAEGLVRAVWEDRKRFPHEAVRGFLEDAHAFLPVLHERSAPLKLILEHLRLTIPSAGARI